MGLLRGVWRSPGGRTGLVLSVLVVGFAVLGPWLIQAGAARLDILHRFQPPSLMHPAGTDQLGRDTLARLAEGGRLALGVALATIAIALSAGTLLGIAAAYASPRIERLVLAGFDIVAAFPSLILALAVVALFGPGIAKVILIVAATLVPQFGRVARAQALALKSAAFLEAERAIGAPAWRVLVRHLLPNMLGPLVVLAGMNVPVVIAIEAGLSFLGVGVPPPRASWGTVLNDGYAHLDQSVWPLLTAGLMLAVATLGFTLLGEALRDVVDPRLRRVP
jgi:peptide/nickel transport system permease protein